MNNKTNKAHTRLKEFALFSEDFESFKAIFSDNLDKNKKDEAIELLLMVNFQLLKSDGERFNDLLNIVDDNQSQKLILWLDDMSKKFSLNR
ncbi:hypothetical protein [Sulfurimonas sp.]|uniref:hypothetical protein n=1 Tax=Sulfurimonas sp. TaxID=2022749 RepID=UPI0025F258C8|nr:hypothetical protein [Sulfurimonas sp.]